MGKYVLVENREGHNWYSYRYNNQFPYFFSKIGVYLLKPADIMVTLINCCAQVQGPIIQQDVSSCRLCLWNRHVILKD